VVRAGGEHTVGAGSRGQVRTWVMCDTRAVPLKSGGRGGLQPPLPHSSTAAPAPLPPACSDAFSGPKSASPLISRKYT
jgi:hypothetical protein